MYLEVNPSGSKIWRMSYRQANGKTNRLTFGPYPAVSLLTARKQRDAARERKVAGSEPAQAQRNAKQSKAKQAVAGGVAAWLPGWSSAM